MVRVSITEIIVCVQTKIIVCVQTKIIVCRLTKNNSVYANYLMVKQGRSVTGLKKKQKSLAIRLKSSIMKLEKDDI